MKTTAILLILSTASLFISGCVSRTSTIERGVGEDIQVKKTIWIWQDEYRNTN